MHACRIAAFCCVGFLAGCAGIPADRGFAEVQSLAGERMQVALPAPAWEVSAPMEQLITDRLQRPLTADYAVYIALLKNPMRLAEYARLGVAQADLYEAARLENPILAGGSRHSNESGAAHQISLGLTQNLTNLLLLSARKRFAEGEVERIQYDAAASLHRFATGVRGAFHDYVGALQVARMRALVARAADVSASLAQRFHDAGNINRLELSREMAAATAAAIETDAAAAEAEHRRMELANLMGLETDGKWTVDQRIALPVAEEDPLDALLPLAREQRLDIRAARLETALIADALDVARSYRLLGQVEIGVDYERETDRSRLLGPSLSLELPIFNQGADKVLRAQALLDDSRARLQSLEVRSHNAVVLACQKVQVARRRIERYREQLIPHREEIVQRSQELQNFMILGQFELLAAKQEEYDAYEGYLQSLRGYWVARAELAGEIGTALPSGRNLSTGTVDLDALVQPRRPAQSHEGHAMPGMQQESMPERDTPRPGQHPSDRSLSDEAPMHHQHH